MSAAMRENKLKNPITTIFQEFSVGTMDSTDVYSIDMCMGVQA